MLSLVASRGAVAGGAAARRAARLPAMGMPYTSSSSSCCLRHTPIPHRRLLPSAGTSLSLSSRFSSATISAEERAALRAARKERATRVLQQTQQQQAAQHVHQSEAAVAGEAASASSSSGAAALASTAASQSSASSSSSIPASSLAMSRWAWYLGLAVPTALLVWAFQDENSPPAKLSKMVGLTGLIEGYADRLAKPSFDKLLPDWSQMPNVPHDIPVPPTLVLDLENTLVSSTWDRKYGWRHAKRPGVDKFLHELAQYYEIVLYSPSIDGVADPVVTSLDRDGCILHRLYRDATYYSNGVHVKDLRRLNRDLRRMIVLDDDPAEVQFNPENLIRIKPYTDPTDRTDSSLLRILPFLVEIAREGYNDIPALLSQYRGMDADEIADEQDRRVSELRDHRVRRAQQGLGRLAMGGGGGAMGRALPPPELPPASDLESAYYRSNVGPSPPQLTAKDIAGKAPDLLDENSDGFMGWIKRRAKEKEEHQMRKLEKWNEVMIKKQREKRENAA